MFIYKITNIKNNKIYIGQTTQKISRRLKRHKTNLKLNKHHNDHLQRSWNKYGENNFTFEIIDQVVFKNSLNNLEKFWIKYYDTTNPKKGYNKDSGGSNGKKFSHERIKKMSSSMIGKFKGEKHPLYNKTQSIETRSKISSALQKFYQKNTSVNLGRKRPDLSERNKKHKPLLGKKGKLHPSFGKSPPNKKLVSCFNLETNISIIDSVKNISKLTNKSEAMIQKVCRTKVQIYKNLILNYVTETK